MGKPVLWLLGASLDYVSRLFYTFYSMFLRHRWPTCSLCSAAGACVMTIAETRCGLALAEVFPEAALQYREQDHTVAGDVLATRPFS